MNRQAEYENRFHRASEIPYSYYKCSVPDISICVPLHWHKELEVNFILEGKASFRVNDETFLSQAGDIFVIQPNALHSIYPYEKETQVYETLVFDSDILEMDKLVRGTREYIEPIKKSELLLCPHISAGDRGYEAIYQCTQAIFGYAKKNSALDDMMVKGKTLEFMYYMIQNGHVRTEDTYQVLPALKPVLEYISLHFRETIRISELAERVHLSESYFMSLFQGYIGLSAMEYINQLRLKEACLLLQTSNQSVMEIAFTVGFRNLSNFNRHFKKMTGISPTEYRRLICQTK